MLRRRRTTIGAKSSTWAVCGNQLVGGPEQKWSVNAQDGDVAGNLLVLEDVRPSASDVVLGDARNGRRGRDASDEHQRRDDHAGLDGDRQIREHRQGKRPQPHNAIRPAMLPELRDLAPLAHVVGHDEQDRCEDGHRDEGGQARSEQQDHEQRAGMNHPRHRGPAARAHVRGRARDRAGRRQTADDRRHDVGDALREELHVGVVPVTAHPVGDDRRQQRLDGTQHRDRQRRRQQRQDQVGTKARNVNVRQAGRDAAEARADRLDGSWATATTMVPARSATM